MIGRKNWVFTESPKGVKASATTFSLIETAKVNNLELYDYIEYLLEMMPNVDIVYHPRGIDKCNQLQSQNLSS